MNNCHTNVSRPLLSDLERGSESFLSALQTRERLEGQLRGRKVDDLHLGADYLFRAASFSLCLGLCMGTAAYTFWKISHRQGERATDPVVLAAIIGAVCLMPALFTGLGVALNCKGDRNVAAQCSLLERDIRQVSNNNCQATSESNPFSTAKSTPLVNFLL
jgi:hypothetical protein